jgi:hypothetical protein
MLAAAASQVQRCACLRRGKPVSITAESADPLWGTLSRASDTRTAARSRERRTRIERSSIARAYKAKLRRREQAEIAAEVDAEAVTL